jgi:hypothetical protein
MKNIFTKVLMGAAVIASSLLPLNAAAAGSATFSLGASTGSVVNGGSFTVSVYENGDAVNVITAKLDYDASKVQFNGMSCAGSFTRVAESNGATCYTSPGTTVSGSQLVGVATFKALAGSGTATVSMNAGSKIVGGNPATDMWNHAPVATSVAMTTPVTPPTTPPPATGGSSTSPSTSQNPSTPASNSAKTSATSKTATSGNSTTNQTAATNSTKEATGDDTSVLGESKKNTPASKLATLQKNVSVSLLWPIIAAILVILIGAGAIYARRNPRQFAAASSSLALAAASAKKSVQSVFKKTAVAPVAKKPVAKTAAEKKAPAKKKPVAKKAPANKAKTTKVTKKP